MKILVLSRYTRKGPSSRIRFYQYFSYLSEHDIEVTTAPLLGDNYLERLFRRSKKNWWAISYSYFYRLFVLLQAKRFDVLWIEKELYPWLPAWFERLLNLLNIPYVVDFDDAIYEVYKNCKHRLPRALLERKIESIVENASIVVVGNQNLGQWAEQFGAGKIEYLPTVVDLDHYPKKSQRKNDVFTVGWIGSPLTAEYLKVVEEPLAKFCEFRNARIRLVGAGNIDLPGVPLEIVPWSEATEAENIRSFDVGIMPLSDGPWERGKCGYKLIQYMACAVPVIASPIGANAKIIRSGVNGFLAASSCDWLSCLALLWNDDQLRARLGAQGREIVEKKYCVKVTAPRLVTILNQVVERGKTDHLIG